MTDRVPNVSRRRLLAGVATGGLAGVSIRRGPIVPSLLDSTDEESGPEDDRPRLQLDWQYEDGGDGDPPIDDVRDGDGEDGDGRDDDTGGATDSDGGDGDGGNGDGGNGDGGDGRDGDGTDGTDGGDDSDGNDDENDDGDGHGGGDGTDGNDGTDGGDGDDGDDGSEGGDGSDDGDGGDGDGDDDQGDGDGDLAVVGLPIRESNVLPGDSRTVRIDLQVAGEQPTRVVLEPEVDGELGAVIDGTLEDADCEGDENDVGSTIVSDSLAGMDGEEYELFGGACVEPGETNCLSFSWRMDESVDDRWQGESVAFDLRFRATSDCPGASSLP